MAGYKKRSAAGANGAHSDTADSKSSVDGVSDDDVSATDSRVATDIEWPADAYFVAYRQSATVRSRHDGETNAGADDEAGATKRW